MSRGKFDDEEFGYDGKYAMHMLRLGLQGCELLRTGRISVPMREDDRQYLLTIRRGESTRQAVLTHAGTLERELKDLIEDDASPLPLFPDSDGVEKWMLKEYWTTWQARYGNPSHWLYDGQSEEERKEWLEETRSV